MNLSEALDAALPEIPRARLTRSRPPCIDPELIFHEYVLDGEPLVGVLQRGKGNYFRFAPLQWQLTQLFNGERSYDEIAAAYSEQTGDTITAEDVRSFAEHLDTQEFWYKTHQEKNLAMSEKLLAERRRRAKSKLNLAHISFSAWDPDQYLGWLDRTLGSYIYSKWSLYAVLLLFLFEGVVSVANWKVIGPDTALFYNFSRKSFADFALFWVLLFAIGFLHESAHGLTCKHFGGQVHSMGLMFLYLVPCFFVDVTEGWISASKVQRLCTIIAGIWIELTICGMAMVVWTNTPPGEWIHDFAYEIILLTGIAVVVINLNPLIKLDGYYFLTEIIEIPELKERSTAFLSAWFQAKILRLDVEIPIVPRRRVTLFVLYAVSSGAYSYLLLFLVVRLCYNITVNWLGGFALVPAVALAFVLFRSRLRALRNMTAHIWKNRTKSGLPWRRRYIPAAILVAALFFVPLWRDRENAFFVIEPSQTRILHAAVDGRIDAVFAKEGERVRAGEPLLRMSSLTSASMQSAAVAQTRTARFQAFNAELEGKGPGAAAAEQTAAARSTRLAEEAQSSLLLSAPADGIVLTSNPALLLDQDIASGQSLLTIADAGPRTVRIYIPASALDRIPNGAEVALALPGHFSVLRLRLAPPDGDPVALPPGMVAKQGYQGIQMAVFYCSRIILPESQGSPAFGLAGEARIFGERLSLAQRIARIAFNLARSHIW